MDYVHHNHPSMTKSHDLEHRWNSDKLKEYIHHETATIYVSQDMISWTLHNMCSTTETLMLDKVAL